MNIPILRLCRFVIIVIFVTVMFMLYSRRNSQFSIGQKNFHTVGTKSIENNQTDIETSGTKTETIATKMETTTNTTTTTTANITHITTTTTIRTSTPYIGTSTTLSMTAKITCTDEQLLGESFFNRRLLYGIALIHCIC